MQKGNDLIISVDGAALAASKSCGIDMDVDTKEVALAGAGSSKSYIAGRTSWSITTNHLVGDTGKVEDMLRRVGKVFELSVNMRSAPPDAERMRGMAICTQCKITATRGSLIQGSFTWKGTGPLE